MANADSSDDDSVRSSGSYSTSTPFVTQLEYEDGSDVPYKQMHQGEWVPFGPYFGMPEGVEPICRSLCDKNDYLVGQWRDNGDVLMVSTIHNGHDTCMKKRRRPQESQNNKRHVQRVWGENHTVTKIPGMINDYNSWMNGVDKADQFITYYRTKLRCRRTWMPICTVWILSGSMHS
jgi:hypothetical protein